METMETQNAYAIRKFMYYAYNFKSKNFVINGQGETLPSFFTVWEDMDGIMRHMVSKWHDILHSRNCGGTQAIIYFYMELSVDNQGLMANYICQNYTGV